MTRVTKALTLAFTEFTLDHALQVTAWRYPAPYECYDSPPWEQVCQEGWAICDPKKRDTQFTAVVSGEDRRSLVGFYRLRIDGQPPTVVLSCGLRPDCCGQGLGQTMVNHALERASDQFPGIPVSLLVRPFNARAIRLYGRLGFEAVAHDDSAPMYQMTRQPNDGKQSGRG